MFSGSRRLLPFWCQPALSQSNTAQAPGATWVLISARWRFIISVLAAGAIIAAPTPRLGQIAPKM
jgi:hypothetical protein